MKTLSFKAFAMLIILLAVIVSCQTPPTSNWSQAGQYNPAQNPDMNCGDSLKIQLSKGDTITITNRDVIVAGACQAQLNFSHLKNGATINDTYFSETGEWIIKHDSTTLRIDCLPKSSTRGCFLRIAAK
jgi:hypothetical protein